MAMAESIGNPEQTGQCSRSWRLQCAMRLELHDGLQGDLLTLSAAWLCGLQHGERATRVRVSVMVRL